jgi:hypothetical protein
VEARRAESAVLSRGAGSAAEPRGAGSDAELRGAGSDAEPRGAESAPLGVGAWAERRAARCRGTRARAHAAVHAARRVPIGCCYLGLECPFMEQTIVQHTHVGQGMHDKRDSRGCIGGGGPGLSCCGSKIGGG